MARDPAVRGAKRRKPAPRMHVPRKIREHIGRDRFARSLGIKLLELHAGYARCSMVVRKEMMNFHGTAHGGVIFSLADAAFAAACNAYGQTAVALEMNVNFVKSVEPGTRLIAQAEEESQSARVGLYHLTVVDGHGNLIASLHATAYRKQEWFVKQT